MKNTYQRANRTHNSSTRDWWFFRHGRVYYFSLQVLLDSMISAVFHRSVQRESGNVVLLWTSPSSRLPDDVGRFHPSNPLFQPTRYNKPSFLAHIKTYAFRYPNIPKDHTVNVPYYGCSPFSRRGVDRFGPAKVRDASARQRIITLSPPFSSHRHD